MSPLASNNRARVALLVLVVLGALLLLYPSASPSLALDRLGSSDAASNLASCTPTAATPSTDSPTDLYSLPGLLTTRPLPSNASQSYPFWLPLSYASGSLPPTHGQLLPILLQHLYSATSSPSPLPQPLRGLQNSTILLFGDSNERALVDHFCSDIAGKEAEVRMLKGGSREGAKWHADPHVCQVDLGVDAEGKGERAWLRVVGVMLFGVSVQTEEEGELLWGVRKTELEGPWTLGERVELARRFLQQLDEEQGTTLTPPFVHFSSTLWDLMYAADYSYFSSLPASPLASLPSHSSNPFSFSPLKWGWTPSQLTHYRIHLTSALSLLHTTFPSSPTISLRTLHPLAHVAPPGQDFWNPLRITQLNSAIRSASLSSSAAEPPPPSVRLFDLYRLLEGMPEKDLLANGGKDRVHLEWKTGGWVWMEGVLEGVLEGVVRSTAGHARG